MSISHVCPAALGEGAGTEGWACRQDWIKGGDWTTRSCCTLMLHLCTAPPCRQCLNECQLLGRRGAAQQLHAGLRHLHHAALTLHAASSR